MQGCKRFLEKDVQNLVSKQFFARWQELLSIFYFKIDVILGENNNLPDLLSHEFLQGHLHRASKTDKRKRKSLILA